MTPTAARLVILYGIGGLSDVGRHAVLTALREYDATVVESVCVLTRFPELLEEKNWECGCPEDHEFTAEEKERMKVVHVKSWKDEKDDLTKYFADATAVVSCLGNRQPGLMNPKIKTGWESHEGNEVVISAMKQHNIKRSVVISSMGVEEDWPPMEFHWGGKILALLFQTNTRTAFQDLTKMERSYRAASGDIDFLLVRPVGIGEEEKPVGEWYLQKEKYKDVVGGNMAKMDVARFMVKEALEPTRHKDAVVIGSKPPPAEGETQ